MVRRSTQSPTATRPHWCECTAATARTRRWTVEGIACFDQALAGVGLASGDRLHQLLYDYFAWATTTTMSRYHRSADDVPDGLRIPQWSWDGVVSGTGPTLGG